MLARMSWWSGGDLPEDSLSEEEVAEEGGNEEILAEGVWKEPFRQHIPGYGVGDGGEDPVELAEWRLAVVEVARQAVD